MQELWKHVRYSNNISQYDHTYVVHEASIKARPARTSFQSRFAIHGNGMATVSRKTKHYQLCSKYCSLYLHTHNITVWFILAHDFSLGHRLQLVVQVHLNAPVSFEEARRARSTGVRVCVHGVVRAGTPVSRFQRIRTSKKNMVHQQPSIRACASLNLLIREAGRQSPQHRLHSSRPKNLWVQLWTTCCISQGLLITNEILII